MTKLHPRIINNGTVNPDDTETDLTTNLYEVSMKFTIRANNRAGAHIISHRIVDRVISLVTLKDEIKLFDVDPVITGIRALGVVDDEPHERMNRIVTFIKTGNREQIEGEIK